jgi:hypothetical protein
LDPYLYDFQKTRTTVYDHPSNWSIHPTCALKTISIMANGIVDEMIDGFGGGGRERFTRQV